MSKIKLTIIIPYHAQEETLNFLQRQLHYYNSQFVAVEIILALSGSEKLREKAKKTLRDMENKNFSVIDVAENNIKNFISYISKIYAALQGTETEYVAINGVDDLIVPNVAYKAIKAMEIDKTISGAKGQTIYYTKGNGRLFASYGIDFMEKSACKREEKAAKDLDSIWYIVRRKKDLQEEYRLVLDLIKGSSISNCLYSIELIKSLLMVSKGKVFVLNEPWRLQTSHTHNHSSYVPSSVIRLETGCLSKKVFSKLNVKLRWSYFRFLVFMSNIRASSAITLKQIVYRFLRQEKNLFSFIRSLTYFALNKILYNHFMRILNIFKKQKNSYYDVEINFNNEHFRAMKKYYLTEDEVEKIQKNPLNNCIKMVR